MQELPSDPSIPAKERAIMSNGDVAPGLPGFKYVSEMTIDVDPVDTALADHARLRPATGETRGHARIGQGTRAIDQI
jgi:hypothetical protein